MLETCNVGPVPTQPLPFGPCAVPGSADQARIMQQASQIGHVHGRQDSARSRQVGQVTARAVDLVCRASAFSGRQFSTEDLGNTTCDTALELMDQLAAVAHVDAVILAEVE